ncbi:MAG: cation diffusion facilitator family transporter [Candidatus Omnitrophota bacterium]
MDAVQDPVNGRSDRARQIATVLWVTLALNWAVAALKIVFGLSTRCMAITADGVHSFSDGASNVIGLIAMNIAGHPADREHPYGHQKFETIASAVIAFFLGAVGFGIARESITGLFSERAPEVSPASFALMGLTFFVNLAVVWYERRKGRQLQSDLLVSDSWHTLTDVFVTLGVIAALVGIGLGMPRLDSIFSLVIALVIVVTAFMILKRSSDVLVDRAVLKTGQIEKVVRAVRGVRDCHEIRTRGRRDSVYVDLHVLVDDHMTVLESHRLANIIEHNVREGIPGVCDVVVHIEPVSHGHEEL